MEYLNQMSIMEKAIALMQSDLFKPIPTDEVALIAARTEDVRFEAGETLDETTTSFFFIIEGFVELRRKGTLVRQAPAGTSFGLLGLVGIGESEMETKFIHKTLAVALTQEAFFETIADHPAFAIEFIRGISGGIRLMADKVQALEKKVALLEGKESPPPSGLPV